MEIIQTADFTASLERHPDAAAWMDRWTLLTEKATWSSLRDVRSTFPTADGVKLKSETVVTVFNVKGNSYRLITTIIYEAGIVTAVDLLTHAEYDREKWKRNL